MKRQSLYNYSVTGRFPQDLKAYIKTPKVGENGNELTFGWDNDNLLAEGKNVNPITFSGTAKEPYEVTFNALTYEVTPLVNVLFDGRENDSARCEYVSYTKILYATTVNRGVGY